jgi:hypothetical protein
MTDAVLGNRFSLHEDSHSFLNFAACCACCACLPAEDADDLQSLFIEHHSQEWIPRVAATWGYTQGEWTPPSLLLLVDA